MTKTKREIRKEAVERLNDVMKSKQEQLCGVDIIEALTDIDYMADEQMVYAERIIDLLTDDDMDEYVKLPVDANGEVIHIGDELTNPQHAGSFTVEAIGGNGSIPHVVYFRCNNGKLGFHYTNQCRRYHKPTIEDVLREFSDEVRRCCDTEDTIAEYAAKLKEAMVE